MNSLSKSTTPAVHPDSEFRKSYVGKRREERSEKGVHDSADSMSASKDSSVTTSLVPSVADVMANASASATQLVDVMANASASATQVCGNVYRGIAAALSGLSLAGCCFRVSEAAAMGARVLGYERVHKAPAAPAAYESKPEPTEPAARPLVSETEERAAIEHARFRQKLDRDPKMQSLRNLCNDLCTRRLRFEMAGRCDYGSEHPFAAEIGRLNTQIATIQGFMGDRIRKLDV